MQELVLCLAVFLVVLAPFIIYSYYLNKPTKKKQLLPRPTLWYKEERGKVLPFKKRYNFYRKRP